MNTSSLLAVSGPGAQIWVFVCPQGQPGQFSERMSGSLMFPCANTLGSCTCPKCADKEGVSKFLNERGTIWGHCSYCKIPNLATKIWWASYHTRESGGIWGWSFTLEKPSTENKHLYPLIERCSLFHIYEKRDRTLKHHDVKSIPNISKEQKAAQSIQKLAWSIFTNY